ncbi:MAG: TetR family transcriptional regulator C-terminal domain-containing protein [Cyanobacteria bacterium SZAS-4]|nr:TetR family transcriptional regulator C-terminal domain-containing protein [Cyanobacteria bacterium SZAS-4]
MGRTSATKESTKLQLLEAGIDIMIEKGYNNTGIMEVLQKTGVPKGSFYYYFDSKEEFGLQIINYFNDNIVVKKRKPLEDKTVSPLQRLRNYCDELIRNIEQNECRKGCLIDNLSQEMADQSEVFRNRLKEIGDESTAIFAECIREGQELNEIPKCYDSQELAEFINCSIKGAIGRAKLLKNTEPIKVVFHILFDFFLKTNC